MLWIESFERNNKMGVGSIPVDLFNPGQVFACVGFLEAADVLIGDAQGGFDWSNDAGAQFHMRASGAENPFAVVLSFLSRAKVVSLAPPGSKNSTDKWGVPTEVLSADEPFPFPDPTSPATLPALLEGEGFVKEEAPIRLVVDHWGDTTERDPVKFWGGAAGYPGAALTRDALDLVRDRCLSAVTDPLNLPSEQSSSFRLDWRRDYIPIDAGFSLNNHKGIVSLGFPLVEILAALGLGNARPKRLYVLEYKYGVLGSEGNNAELPFFDPVLLRAALGGSDLPFGPRNLRIFRMRLGWPAKEGQARAITIVTEESDHE